MAAHKKKTKDLKKAEADCTGFIQAGLIYMQFIHRFD